ncbi:MAG: hypothetical protein R3324_01920 [Halobacteriales archaeon]|nr:hypothetical protein [Halobacteriales archaeon]
MNIEARIDTGSATPRQPSSEAIYGLLADRRRRYALHYLMQRGEPVTLRDLAEQVAAWENRKPADQLGAQERKRVYIALYQSHMPSMDREGVVEYDADRGEIALAPAFADIDIYLEAVPRNDVPWSVYYLGLSAANALLLLLAFLEVAPFDSLPDLVWGAVALVTFAGSALAQTVLERRMRFGDDGPPPELARSDGEADLDRERT